MAEGNRTLPLWQRDSITVNHVLLLRLPAPVSLALSKTPRSFDLILGCYHHQATGGNLTGKRKCGSVMETLSMIFSCQCSHAVSVELTSFSFCWGEGGSIRASWTTVSQTCACGPLAVSLNWTGSSKLAPCPLAKMDPSACTLKKGSLLWKSTASFPMQSSNFTADKIIRKILI